MQHTRSSQRNRYRLPSPASALLMHLGQSSLTGDCSRALSHYQAMDALMDFIASNPAKSGQWKAQADASLAESDGV